MYLLAENPTLSFRPVDEQFLIVGGFDHKTGANNIDLDSSYKNLENYIRTIYPNANVKYKWATQDCVSLDKVPYIGKFSNVMKNIYVATGFKKWGMTTSHVAANIISDMILGKDNKYSYVYEATRFNPLKNYKEFGNMLKQTVYSLGINKITPPKEKFENLKNGTGGIVEYKGKKLGIYKDDEGNLFAVKPYCAHLGCELSWNNLEKTWDCPCHGSRYTFEGKLITEPSTKDLEKFPLHDF